MQQLLNPQSLQQPTQKPIQETSILEQKQDQRNNLIRDKTKLKGQKKKAENENKDETEDTSTI